MCCLCIWSLLVVFVSHLSIDRALVLFTLGDSKQLVTLEVGMTEADISNNVVGESGLIMAAAFLLRME